MKSIHNRPLTCWRNLIQSNLWLLPQDLVTDILPQDLVKSPSREIGCYNDRIALEFDRHLDSAAFEVPVKFQIDWKSINSNLEASRLHEISRQGVRPLNE